MKNWALLCAMVLVPAYGQQKADKGTIELTRKAIQLQRQEMVTTAMDLTEKESQAFWPLYREWRGKMAVLGDRVLALIDDLDQHYGAITDQKAREMLDEWLKIQADEVKLKQEYVKRFRKILPDKKVARFFHVENKLDATVENDLAGRIPLVE